MSSQSADDLYNPQTSKSADGGRYSGFTKVVESDAPRIGRPPPAYDRRKFKYDVLEARKLDLVPWHITKDDRMEAEEAGAKLNILHRLYGIEKENPDILQAFDNALFFAHTINSGSVLQPGRSDLIVRGTHMTLQIAISYLGNDIRRFFRAYADEIRAINKQVLAGYDPADIEAVEKHGWLMEVAADRGLFRYPDLCHDSSDKCILNPAERAAVSNSKMSVFGSIVNAADRFNSNARMTTSDDFDSTNLVTVPNKSTITN